MELEHNAAAIAAGFEEAAGELADLEETNLEAGRVALALIDPATPRRTGTLAAGARSVADAFGFAYVNAVPYAVIVDTRQGFATDTLREHEAAIVAVYEDHVTDSLAPIL